MSEQTTFPAKGISHLIIDEMARDARVWGIADATEIQVTFQTADETRQTWTTEGDTLRFDKGTVRRISLPAAVAVTIKRVLGDFHVRGLSGDVNLEAVHGDLRVSKLDGTTRIAQVDGDLRADEVADLRLLGNCSGDLRFDSSGALEAESVDGDVRIAAAASIRLGRVHGDLWAERLDGGLDADRVNGDMRLNEIAGPVNVRVLRGDLRAIGLSGGLIAPQVQGDAALQGALGGDATYTMTTYGDIGVILPADADARLTVRANGRIRSEVQLTPAADGSPTFTATIGQGTGRVNLTSGGDLRIAQAGAASSRKAEDVREPVTPEDLRNLGDRIRQQVTASLAAAGIMVEGRHGGRGPKFAKPAHPATPATPATPAAPAPFRPFMPPAQPKPVPEEELRILKMVEDGTLTAEQAEMLLKALGE